MAWVGGAKTPPYSVHLEKAVLGGILADHALVPEARSRVRSGDAFFRSQHGVLYDAILALYRRRKTLHMDRWIDEVAAALAKKETLELIGGRRYLEVLAAAAPSRTPFIEAAETVRDKAVLRRLIDIVSETLSEAYGGASAASDIIARARDELDRLAKEIG